MGATTSVTQMIFFIASLIIVTGVISIFVFSVQSISGGIETRENFMTGQLRTGIDIINDPGNFPNDPVLIYVKNIGSMVLDQNLVNVIMDGRVMGPQSLNVSDDREFWEPTSILTISLNLTLE